MRKLKVEDDAFGHALWAAYKGKKDVFEILERDDGFVDVMKVSGYFSEYKAGLRLNRKLCNL